jgi:hypothetical protein
VGPLHHADGTVKGFLAPLDNFEHEEPKQRVADVGASDLLYQGTQVAAVSLRVEGQQVAVGVRVVDEAGDVDFLGLAHGAPPF